MGLVVASGGSEEAGWGGALRHRLAPDRRHAVPPRTCHTAASVAAVKPTHALPPGRRRREPSSIGTISRGRFMSWT